MLTGRRRERDKDLERKELNWEEETHGNFKILENIVCVCVCERVLNWVRLFATLCEMEQDPREST